MSKLERSMALGKAGFSGANGPFQAMSPTAQVLMAKSSVSFIL